MFNTLIMTINILIMSMATHLLSLFAGWEPVTVKGVEVTFCIECLNAEESRCVGVDRDTLRFGEVDLHYLSGDAQPNLGSFSLSRTWLHASYKYRN
jgi:hypothetical protein